LKEVVVQLKLRRLNGGGFVATCKDVPGLIAQGRTVAETAEIAQGVARNIAELCARNGQPLPLPAPLRQRSPSGSEQEVAVAIPRRAASRRP